MTNVGAGGCRDFAAPAVVMARPLPLRCDRALDDFTCAILTVRDPSFGRWIGGGYDITLCEPRQGKALYPEYYAHCHRPAVHRAWHAKIFWLPFGRAADDDAALRPRRD